MSTALARRAIFVIVSFTSALLVAPLSAATPNVGEHLHAQVANLPTEANVIPRSPRTLQVTLKGHDSTGKVTSFEVQDYSVTMKKVSVSLPACHDCSISFPFSVDFSAWSCGRHELRFRANIPVNVHGKRQFTTTRAFVNLAGCTTDHTSGHASWKFGGGGWYNDYSIALLMSPVKDVKAGAEVSVRVQSGAERGCLYRNPDFHNGSHGTQIGSCWTGQSTVKRTIPTSTVNGDRIVIYSQDGANHAGLAVLTVGDAADGVVTYEWQDWWAQSGLVLP